VDTQDGPTLIDERRVVKPNEIRTFNHCELRVPDELKYPLHQLFIIHGQQCYRCTKAGKESSREQWESCVCPLEDLMDRGKTGVEAKERKKQKKGKGKAEAGVEAEDEADRAV